jgi:hypothetical protein
MNAEIWALSAADPKDPRSVVENELVALRGDELELRQQKGMIRPSLLEVDKISVARETLLGDVGLDSERLTPGEARVRHQ